MLLGSLTVDELYLGREDRVVWEGGAVSGNR